MKSYCITLVDFLTVVLFVPFFLLVLVGTGLTLYVVIDRDTSETAQAQEYAAPRIRRYIVLPSITPETGETSVIEPVRVEPNPPPTELPEHAAELGDLSAEAEPLAPPDTNVEAGSAEAATTPTSAGETTASSTYVQDPAPTTAQDDVQAPAEDEPSEEVPAEVALAETELPDTTSDDTATDEPASPPTPVPTAAPTPTASKPTPPPPRPTEPAPVPDVSFFDDLLDQVRQ